MPRFDMLISARRRRYIRSPDDHAAAAAPLPLICLPLLRYGGDAAALMETGYVAAKNGDDARVKMSRASAPSRAAERD